MWEDNTMGKEKELLERVVETLKKQQIQITELNLKIAKYTDAYLEGIKEGIAFMIREIKK